MEGGDSRRLPLDLKRRLYFFSVTFRIGITSSTSHFHKNFRIFMGQ